MNYPRSRLFTALGVLALAAASFVAYADEYSEVTQMLRAGKLNEAMVKADSHLAVKPTDPQMRFLKGVIQRTQGKQAEAIATFTKLTEDYPELPEPYNNLAVLYAGQSQFDKARVALEMAIRTNPSYATAHENLGDVYARLASQAYNKALQLDGANVAVAPKLALISELFSPNNKGQRPASSAQIAASAASAAALAKAASAASAAALAKAASAAKAPSVVASSASPAASVPLAAASKTLTAPVKADSTDNAAKETRRVEEAVQAWARAWAAKDVPAYLSTYGKEFTPAGKQTRSAWEDERRQRITGKSSISVKIEDLTVTVNANRAVAKFKQSYRADALSVSSRKTLELVKTGERWLITKESTGS